MRAAAVCSPEWQIYYRKDAGGRRLWNYLTSYMVLEYLSGMTLKDYVKRQGGRLSYDGKRIVSGYSPCFNPETVANSFGMQAFYSTLFLQSA